MTTIPYDAIPATREHTTGSFIYFLMDGDECVYVGQTANLRQRILGHGGKTFDRTMFIHVDDGIRLSAEQEWISRLRPKYNGYPGRPSKEPEQKRSKVLFIKLTKSEKREIIAAAKSYGMKTTTWVRDVIFSELRKNNVLGE